SRVEIADVEHSRSITQSELRATVVERKHVERRVWIEPREVAPGKSQTRTRVVARVDAIAYRDRLVLSCANPIFGLGIAGLVVVERHLTFNALNTRCIWYRLSRRGLFVLHP